MVYILILQYRLPMHESLLNISGKEWRKLKTIAPTFLNLMNKLEHINRFVASLKVTL